MASHKMTQLVAISILFIFSLYLPVFAEDSKSGKVIALKATGVPDRMAAGPVGLVSIAVVKEFQRLNPDIRLLGSIQHPKAKVPAGKQGYPYG